MSRTYRLRHDRVRHCRKWSNGQFTAAESQSINQMYDLVAHGIFHLPCLIDGQMNAYGHWDIKDYSWSSTLRTHNECMRSLGLSHSQNRALFAILCPIYNILPYDRHPYTHRRWLGHKKALRKKFKGLRKRNVQEIQQMLQSRDYDDLGSHPNHCHKIYPMY